MSQFKFKSEAEYEEAVLIRIDEALTDAENEIGEALKEALKDAENEIDGLRAKIAELGALVAAKPSKVPVDRFAAFADHPVFHAAISATTLLPSSLPTLAAFEVFKGATKASAIQAIVPATAKMGTRGGGATTVRSITNALETAASAFLLANKGVGIKIATIRATKATPLDADVRVFKFAPIVELSEEKQPEAGDSEQRMAAE